MPDLYRVLFGKEDPVDASVTDWAEHGRVGGVSTGQPFKYTTLVGATSGQAARVEDNGGLAVNLQDQTTQALDLRFIQQLDVDSLANPTAVGDLDIDLTDATGFVDGNVVGFVNPNGNFCFPKQVGAAVGNTITIDTPIDRVYPTADTTIIRASDDLAVDGSGTTQIFQVGPIGVAAEIEVDITRIMGYIQTGFAMDDALFGNLAALTNGVVLRHNNNVINNIWNAKTNGELALICFDSEYTTKAPSGSFGFRFRNTYAGQSKHGVTIRLAAGEKLEILIQDNLSTLEAFSLMAQGHVVTD